MMTIPGLGLVLPAALGRHWSRTKFVMKDALVLGRRLQPRFCRGDWPPSRGCGPSSLQEWAFSTPDFAKFVGRLYERWFFC